MSAPFSILVVEDNDEDFDMLRVTFRSAGIAHPLHRACDGHQAPSLLRELPVRPGLVLLDLNLPGLDGRKVLERIKANEELRSLPVIVFSTSDNPKDVHACYQSGASGYLLKPVDLERFEQMVRSLKSFWFEFIVSPPGPPREAGHV